MCVSKQEIFTSSVAKNSWSVNNACIFSEAKVLYRPVSCNLLEDSSNFINCLSSDNFFIPNDWSFYFFIIFIYLCTRFSVLLFIFRQHIFSSVLHIMLCSLVCFATVIVVNFFEVFCLELVMFHYLKTMYYFIILIQYLKHNFFYSRNF